MAEKLFECSQCGNQSVAISYNGPSCQKCGHKPDATAVAENNTKSDVRDCSECRSEETVACIALGGSDGEWLCCSCGESGEDFTQCIKCAGMTKYMIPHNTSVCELCWDQATT